MLQLRAPDLPRVHDLDPGRDALPRVRQAADADRTAATLGVSGGAPIATYVLIGLNAIVFLAEMLGGGGGSGTVEAAST